MTQNGRSRPPWPRGVFRHPLPNVHWAKKPMVGMSMINISQTAKRLRHFGSRKCLLLIWEKNATTVVLITLSNGYLLRWYWISSLLTPHRASPWIFFFNMLGFQLPHQCHRNCRSSGVLSDPMKAMMGLTLYWGVIYIYMFVEPYLSVASTFIHICSVIRQFSLH